MIVAKIAKAVLKLLLPEVVELISPMKKYCFEENELDVKNREFEQKLTDQGFRITALVDMAKSKDEIIDNMQDEIKGLSNIITKLSNKSAFKKLFK